MLSNLQPYRCLPC